MASVSAQRLERRVPLRSRALHLDLTSERGSLPRGFAAICFAVTLASALALPAFTIAGVQLRALLPVAMLSLFGILYTDELRRVLRRFVLLLLLIVGLALEGAFVSLVNGTPFWAILDAIVSVHIQAAVIVVAAGTMAQVSGRRNAVIAVVAVIGVSALVAALQMLGLSGAWELRTTLGKLQRQPLEMLEFFVRERPMGISYSPIQLATQLTLAFGVFAAFRDSERRAEINRSRTDAAILLALLIFLVACVATATRSPILGGVAFLAIYAAIHRQSWISIGVLFGAGLLYLGWPLLIEAIQSTAPRVTAVDDNSAAARWVYAYYGSRLFLDNPLGYGLAFEPSGMWSAYWSDLYMMRAAQGAQENNLHNYALSILNFYGIGILLFVPIVVSLLRRAGPALLFFIPYIVHILFHNSGPLYNDTIIWFVVAALAAASVQRSFQSSPRHVESWPFGHPELAPAGGSRAQLARIAGAGGTRQRNYRLW